MVVNLKTQAGLLRLVLEVVESLSLSLSLSQLIHNFIIWYKGQPPIASLSLPTLPYYMTHQYLIWLFLHSTWKNFDIGGRFFVPYLNKKVRHRLSWYCYRVTISILSLKIHFWVRIEVFFVRLQTHRTCI